MTETINNLIKLAIFRGLEPTILRLDRVSYQEFVLELRTNFCPQVTDKLNLATYVYMGCKLELKEERESWVNKVYIELE